MHVIETTDEVYRHVRMAERFGTACIGNPLSSQFHGRDFVNWFEVGIPVDLSLADQGSSTGFDRRAGGPVRIVHAPSDPINKGTSHIRRAVADLMASGLELELIELIGVPHKQVARELERCDFVVDELYSDVPGGGLAVEAAACGRPSIVCGYGAEEFSRFIRAERWFPVEYTRPEKLSSAIERMASDPTYRLELGRRAQSFVREVYAPAAVAERVLAIGQGRTPRTWLIQPGGLRYVQGWGLSTDRLAMTVGTILRLGGLAALKLDDKPVLRNALLSLSGNVALA
jgi:hypothetical protein